MFTTVMLNRCVQSGAKSTTMKVAISQVSQCFFAKFSTVDKLHVLAATLHTLLCWLATWI